MIDKLKAIWHILRNQGVIFNMTFKNSKNIDINPTYDKAFIGGKVIFK